MADLIKRLEKEAITFDFFQAVSLLEEKYLKEGGDTRPLETGKIHLSADTGIAFPGSDIIKISKQPDRVRFVLSFMGMVGLTSPLPYHFTDYVRKNTKASKAIYDFLDIFNSRIYTLFYQAWKKYHFIRNFSPETDDPFTKKVMALAGITHAPGNIRLLAYTGLLAGKCRTAGGLETLLSDFFGGIDVHVLEHQPRWAKIEDLPVLGKTMRLGINSLAGDRIWDMSGKIRVIFGPLKRKIFETFLPGSKNIEKAKQLIQSFLVDFFAYDIQIKMQTHDLIPVVLGSDNTRLGETSALGETKLQSGVQSIVSDGST